MKLVIAEKPSVAQSLAAVLGAKERGQGYLQGNGYIVSWCVGHLIGLAAADSYDPKYSKWCYEDLPIIPKQWKYAVAPDKKEQYEVLVSLMNRPDVASLVCATDAGREGELIFRLVYDHAGCRKPFERLWISSMEDSAIREGFQSLHPGSEYDRLYEAALCRAKADWLVGNSCSMHYIRAVVLEELILDNLKQTVKFATEHENEFAQCIMKRTLAKQQEGVKTLQKMLAAKEHRIKELDGIIKKLYEDNFSGKLSDERYMIFSREYEDEQHTLKSEVEELKSQIEEQTSKVVNINSFLTVAKKYTSFETLTPGMLHELIEKIVVHEGDKSSGHRIQKIDIYYSFVGDLETSHVVAQRTLKDRKAA